jgi:enoyl-[acyl-carrier protein] reductase II
MKKSELREHIAQVRDEAPGRPFGVNVLLPSGAPDDGVFGSRVSVREQLDLCYEQKVPVIVSGLGDPATILPEVHAAGCRLVAVVGSVAAAVKVAKTGVDAIIVQGHEAGGHVGPTGTLTLGQAVIRAVDVPVLLAGGIAIPEAVRAALALGAAGVSVGTRFIACEESDAHPSFKQAVVDASEDGTVVTRACTGKPSRALRTPFVESWIGREGEIEPYPERARNHFWRARAGCVDGDLVEGFLPLGQCAALIDSVLPAAEIVELMTESLP